MPPFMTLPSDILFDILSQTSTLQDLYSAVLSCRTVANAFYARRLALLSTVLREEIRTRSFGGKICPYEYAEQVAKQLRPSAIQDQIIIYEAVEPLGSRNISKDSYFKWCLGLYRLYVQCGVEAYEQRHVLLERAYGDILVLYRANFRLNLDEEAEQEMSHQSLNADQRRLPSTCQAVMRKLADDYTRLRRISDRLAVEQQTFCRLALKGPESLEWGSRIVKTFRELQASGQHGALAAATRFERRTYDICRANNLIDSSLTWARHLVAEHLRIGQIVEARNEQQRVLSDLRRGSDEYIAWARQLIKMQKRSGQPGDALFIKAEIWRTMSIRTACYFGWARELADEYRQRGNAEGALSVMQQMHEQTQRELQQHPRDEWTRFHARNSALALASEYEWHRRPAEAFATRKLLRGNE